MNSSEKLELEFDLTFGEAYRGTLRVALFALRYLILLVGIALLTYLVCLFIYNSDSAWRCTAGSIDAWLHPYLVGAVPTLIIMIPLVTAIRVWMVRRNPSLSGKRKYTFSDDGVRIEFGRATSEVKWPFYTRIKETKAFFLLYVTGSFGSIVPKRCFVDAAQLESFRSLVRARAQKYSLKQ